MTVNRWIATQLEESLTSNWSPEFLAAAGSIPDLEIDEIAYGKDALREDLA